MCDAHCACLKIQPENYQPQDILSSYKRKENILNHFIISNANTRNEIKFIFHHEMEQLRV